MGYADGRVDVEVQTRDVWTLEGGIRFHRAGGENATGVEIEDSNLLGTGRELTLRHSSDVDRSTTLVRLTDAHLFGTWIGARADFATSTDGFLHGLSVERPFYALATRRASGFEVVEEKRIEPLYTRGKVRERFGHDFQFAEGFYGVALGHGVDGTHRLRFGATAERHRFFAATGPDASEVIPSGRTLTYPWIGYERIDDRFIEARDLDQIGRTEDLNLGLELRARLGWSTTALGADRLDPLEPWLGRAHRPRLPARRARGHRRHPDPGHHPRVLLRQPSCRGRV